ncbi:MAG: ATP-binding cassette domain-containing protein [Eubacteriales bacterium]
MIDSAMFKHFKAIGDMKSSIAAAENLEEALRSCVKIIRDVSNAENAVIWYYDRDGDKHLHPAYSLGPVNQSPVSVAPGEGVIGTAFTTQEAVCALDYKAEKDISAPENFGDVDIKSMMCVPFYNKYETLGCILFVNKSDGTLFSKEDADICEIMSMLAAMAIDENELNLGVCKQKPVLIKLRGLKKHFKNGDTITHVLNGVDLDVYEGELLVILGESGCGKSTMLNIIGGLDKANEGSFYFMGNDYSNADEKLLTEYRRESIGFIFQSYNLMPNLTAKQNLEFIAELKKDAEDPEKMLELVGLSARKDNYPSQMSGGQQQRVSIARALVKRPRLILADEPTAALDYATSIEVLSVIEQVAASGTSILMVTHNEEITKMADRVIRMRGGKIDEIIINRHPVKATELVW